MDYSAKMGANRPLIGDDRRNLADYAHGLRYTAAPRAGCAVAPGVSRITRDWPVQRLIIVCHTDRVPEGPRHRH